MSYTRFSKLKVGVMKRRYCVLRTVFAGVMAAALFSAVRVWGQEAAEVSGSPEFDESDAWFFNPPEDEFNDKALIDLRYLNEQQAGENG